MKFINLGLKKSRHIITIVMFVVVVLLAASCSTTYKTLKKGDPDKIYALAMQQYEAEEWNKAINLFNTAEPYFSNYSRDDSLKFYRARSAYKDNDFEYAIVLLDDYRKEYGRSPFIEDAEGMYTMSHYYIAPDAKRDQTPIEKAIYTINEFMSRHPNSEKIEEFRAIKAELIDRLFEKAYLNAYTYYKTGYYKSAIIAFKNAIKEYPESSYREDMLYYTVASAFKLADNSVLSKKEDRFLQMIDSYYTFIAEFPESKYRKTADDMLAKGRKYLDEEDEKREKGEVANKDTESADRKRK
ncbi:MAG: outer membrane protein assembly factor BamD [Rikenellaceae bacterium]